MLALLEQAGLVAFSRRQEASHFSHVLRCDLQETEFLHNPTLAVDHEELSIRTKDTLKQQVSKHCLEHICFVASRTP